MLIFAYFFSKIILIILLSSCKWKLLLTFNSIYCFLGVLIDHYSFITTCLIMLFLCLISVGMLWCLPETQSFNIQTVDISSFNNNFNSNISVCNTEFYSSNQSESYKKNWLLKSTEMINVSYYKCIFRFRGYQWQALTIYTKLKSMNL